MVRKIEVILKSLAINCPVLQNWGVGLSMPLLISSTNSEEMSEIVGRLSDNPVVIDSTLSPAKAAEKLRHANSEAVIMRLPMKKLRDNVKTVGKIQMILDSIDKKGDLCFQGFLIGRNLNEDLRETVLEIPLDDFPETFELDVNVVPDREELIIVKNLINEYGEIDKYRLALYSAVAFTFPGLRRERREHDYYDLLKIADNLCDRWQDCDDYSSAISTLRSLLISAVRSGQYRITKVDYFPENLERVLVFDDLDDSVLMTAKTFRAIFSSFLDSMPKSEAKRIFCEAGLAKIGRNGFLTSKVWIRQGQDAKRLNLVRLKIASITMEAGNQKIKLSEYLKSI